SSGRSPSERCISCCNWLIVCSLSTPSSKAIVIIEAESAETDSIESIPLIFLTDRSKGSVLFFQFLQAQLRAELQTPSQHRLVFLVFLFLVKLKMYKRLRALKLVLKK